MERHRILVVDDDPLVASVIKDLLEDSQYDYVFACSVDEALALLTSDPTIDVVLTDILMPGRTGTELIVDAITMRPGIKTMMMSGYSSDERIPDIVPVLQKPFLRQDLLDMLDQACGAPRVRTNWG